MIELTIEVLAFALGVLTELELQHELIGPDAVPDEQATSLGASQAGDGLEATHARPHAPRVVAGTPPVPSFHPTAIDLDPAGPSADLVVAGRIGGDPLTGVLEMVRLDVGREVALPLEIGRHARGVRPDLQPEPPVRLENRDVQWPEPQIVDTFPDGPRPPHVVLTAVELDRHVPVDHPGVLVDAHAADQGQFSGRVEGLEPIPVEEPVIGQPGHAERPR